jgi:uncharacterized protein
MEQRIIFGKGAFEGNFVKLSQNYDYLQAKAEPYAEDILAHDNFLSMQNYYQHGSVSTWQHVLRVAYFALEINKKMHLHCNRRDLVRGALLHDYFLYDWHDHAAELNEHPKLHGFYHPTIALKNAKKDFDLTALECEIIYKHMWPLTLTHVPTKREAWVVSMADKWASFYETIFCR